MRKGNPDLHLHIYFMMPGIQLSPGFDLLLELCIAVFIYFIIGQGIYSMFTCYKLLRNVSFVQQNVQYAAENAMRYKVNRTLITIEIEELANTVPFNVSIVVGPNDMVTELTIIQKSTFYFMHFKTTGGGRIRELNSIRLNGAKFIFEVKLNYGMFQLEIVVPSEPNNYCFEPFAVEQLC